MSTFYIPIISDSALEFWLNSLASLSSVYSPKNCPRVSLPSDGIFQINDSMAAEIAKALGISLPLHVLVPKKFCRRSTNTYLPFINPNFTLDKCFIQINETDLPRQLISGSVYFQVYIASPEYCFISACKNISSVSAAELGSILCASFIPKNDGTNLFYRREAVTSVERINKLLDNSPKMYGRAAALKAVSFVFDNALSPMEYRLAIILTLPLHCGGYGFPRPRLNMKIKLSSAGAAILGIDSCVCDLVWEKEKIIIEYDSNLTHLEIKQHFYDKAKYNALTASGYTVITITARDIKNFNSVESMADLIRKNLNIRKNPARLEQYRDIRWETIHSLFFKKDPHRLF